MQTSVLPTQLTPEAVLSSRAVEDSERKMAERARAAGPHLEAAGSSAVPGPDDHADIFAAPDLDTAAKASPVGRTSGQAQTETWSATERARSGAFMRCVEKDAPTARA